MNFQGIRTRIAEKPYIFLIFQRGGGGGGGGVLNPRMSYGGESFGVRPFFIVAPIVSGACLIMLFSVDERGNLGEKNRLQTTFIYQGRRTVLCS